MRKAKHHKVEAYEELKYIIEKVQDYQAKIGFIERNIESDVQYFQSNMASTNAKFH